MFTSHRQPVDGDNGMFFKEATEEEMERRRAQIAQWRKEGKL
jgi:hypothetical protein